MSTIVSYTSFDYAAVDMVPVIVSFDTSGHIVPLYVRINEKIYHIESFWMNAKYGKITEFHCKLRDGDYLKPLLLMYYENEKVWAIPK